MKQRWKITFILNAIAIIVSFGMIYTLGPSPYAFLAYIPWVIAVILCFIYEKRDIK